MRTAVAGLCTVGLMAALAGCSIDSVIWGPDGARVIAATEDLIHELSVGEPSDLICDDSPAELGAPKDWVGLSAGEPERFVPQYWEEQVALDPQWNINLEGLPEGLTPGSTYPGDVFYQETHEGLCVIEVAWSTLAAEG